MIEVRDHTVQKMIQLSGLLERCNWRDDPILDDEALLEVAGLCSSVSNEITKASKWTQSKNSTTEKAG